MSNGLAILIALATGIVAIAPSAALAAEESAEGRDAEFNRGTNSLENLLSGNLRWTVSQPLLAADAARLPASPDNPWAAVKDPSIVRSEGRWHLFCSLRKQKGGQGRIRIGYLSFADWSDPARADWRLLDLTDDYHGAPQVFYFEPQHRWYLVYQAADKSRNLAYGPCYSTTEDLADPSSWTRPAPLYSVAPGKNAGLDFWVICDERKAHLFFTTLNGRMWRAETPLASFPAGNWSEPVVALEADIFEASHTYRLVGLAKYLTLVEAQDGARRYYKAYLADRLDGRWTPLAAMREQPFASPVNVLNQAQSWTTSYSHGELLRAGINQQLEVDPANLRFVFQGASDEDREGKNYGAIPWRLGILR